MTEKKTEKKKNAVAKRKSSAKPTLASALDIKLTPEIVRSYLCPKATPEEIVVFIYECTAFGLNPFKREIYLIKYSEKDPAKAVVGYEVYLKRADRSKNWNGIAFGTEGSGGDLAAWCKVWRKDWKEPLYHTVDFNEYAQYKGAGGPLNRFWEQKPKTMLKKVAVAQTLRMAFPDEFAGMPYIVEEVSDIDMHSLPDGMDRYFDTKKIETHFKKGDVREEPKKEAPAEEDPEEKPEEEQKEASPARPVPAEFGTGDLPDEKEEEKIPEDEPGASQASKMEINRLMATMVDNYNIAPEEILEKMDKKVGSHDINEFTETKAAEAIKYFKWAIDEMKARRAKKEQARA